MKEGNEIRKILIVFFEGDEEKVIDALKTVLNVGRNTLSIQKLELGDQIQFKNLSINLERREVIRHGKKIELTYTEFEILQLLAQHPGKVFSKEQIYNLVWKELYSGDCNIVMTHIRHIREKIEDDPSHPILLQTVWGVGYKFNDRISSDD